MAAGDSGTSLRRGIAILDALASPRAAREGTLGVVRVAEMIGQDKSQVSRSLKILAQQRMVERDPVNLGYRLSWRFFTLAAAAGERRLLQIAPSLMTALVAQLNERVHLSVLEGGTVLTVHSESPHRAIETAGWVGRTVPLYCTSSGRALLLDHTREELRRLFAAVEFERNGPKSVRNVDELYARIEEARPRGYVVVDQEFEAGLLAAAAPIRNFQGRIVAALNVSAPRFRFRRELRAAAGEIKVAAAQLSGSLGWRATEPGQAIAISQ